MEPEGWIRASAPERRVCEHCGEVHLDGVLCSCLRKKWGLGGS